MLVYLENNYSFSDTVCSIVCTERRRELSKPVPPNGGGAVRERLMMFPKMSLVEEGRKRPTDGAARTRGREFYTSFASF